MEDFPRLRTAPARAGGTDADPPRLCVTRSSFPKPKPRMARTFLRALLTAGALVLAACSSNGGSPTDGGSQGYSAAGTWVGTTPLNDSFELRLTLTQSKQAITGTAVWSLGG